MKDLCTKGCVALIKSFKVRLKPNNKQLTKLFQYAGCARYAYNWALTRQIENNNYGCRFITDEELRKEFTQMKQEKDKEWLNDVSNNVMKQAIKDACKEYNSYLKGEKVRPHFRSRANSMPSFYQDNCKIKFTSTHVRVEKLSGSRKKSRDCLNWIRLSEKDRIPVNAKYINPRFKFDGLDWYVTVGVEVEEEEVPEKTFCDGIGIDLGVITFATCSDRYKYMGVNKCKRIKTLEKRKKRYIKSLKRKYNYNKGEEGHFKTKNILKLEKKILAIKIKLNRIRDNYIHFVTNSIIRRNPEFICIEDLDISDMMKNHILAKAIKRQHFAEFRKQIIYKSIQNHIKVVIADRYFPSSKKCICCGNIKHDLKISDRIYRCTCGNVIDRDYQASLNLQEYGRNYLLQNAT